MMRPAIFAAVLLATTAIAQTADEKAEPGFNEDTFKGLALRNIGPALMSGRIADIAISPTDQSTWYVGVGSGGVWKTVNAGTTWQPVFDDAVCLLHRQRHGRPERLRRHLGRHRGERQRAACRLRVRRIFEP
ncbi:MAG: hypothetical protein U5K76_16005 [Woeseiaceae bacterium]|nr:hypothetical protein [Woeseiaceae bacterium]